MGIVQSIAQTILDDTKISLPLATISKIPDIPYDIDVVGQIAQTLEIVNNNPLGSSAHVKSSRATLIVPPLPDSLGPELAGLSGEFAHFDLPELDVGFGKTSKKFTADFTVTNKTLLVGWTFQALIGGEAKLGVTGNPEVAISPKDPYTYKLDLSKELTCKPVNGTAHVGVGATDDPDFIAPVSISCSFARTIPRNEVKDNCVGPGCLADMDFAYETMGYPLVPDWSFRTVGSIPDYPDTLDGVSPIYNVHGHGRASGSACGKQNFTMGGALVTINFPRCPWGGKNHIFGSVEGGGSGTIAEQFNANVQVTPPPAPVGAIRSRKSGKCLDLPGGDASNGNVLWTWECDGGSASQVWDWHDSKIHYAADPSYCLDLPGNDQTDGNRLWLWECSLLSPGQKWGYDQTAGTVWLASSEQDASKCMDLVNGTEDGTPVQIWDCLDSITQEWQLDDPTPIIDWAISVPFLGGPKQSPGAKFII